MYYSIEQAKKSSDLLLFFSQIQLFTQRLHYTKPLQKKLSTIADTERIFTVVLIIKKKKSS